MSDVATFYKALTEVDRYEAQLKKAKQKLKIFHKTLVLNCPHTEVVDHKMSSRGSGTWRTCKICGLEDHALIGATDGDEYNYGYAGSIDRSFWGDCEVETVDEKTFWKYRKGHGFQVKNSSVWKYGLDD